MAKAAKKTSVKKTNKKSAKKAPAKKTATKKAVKKAPAKKKAAPKKKAATKKKAVKKAPAKKKAAPKKTATKAVKKVAPKKAAPKKTATKKAVSKKTAAKKRVKRTVIPVENGHKFKAAPFMSTSKAKAVQNAKKSRGSKLTPKDIKMFQEMLLDKRQSLVGDLTDLQAGSLGRNLQESAGDLSTAPTHPADLGTDNFEQEFTLGLMESERALLNEIDEALDRIDAREYGICQGTGKPISKARLLARPWCKYSIEYKRLVEQGLINPEDDEDEEEVA